MAEEITAEQYFRALALGLAGRNKPLAAALAGLAMLSVAIVAFARRRGGAAAVRDSQLGLLLGWLGIATHYVCFPLLSNRFFIYPYLLIAIAVARLLAHWHHPGLRRSPNLRSP
jgi:hypothetical protein